MTASGLGKIKGLEESDPHAGVVGGDVEAVAVDKPYS